MRRGGIKYAVTTVKTGGRKGRGRSRVKISDGLTKSHGIKSNNRADRSETGGTWSLTPPGMMKNYEEQTCGTIL